MPSRVLLIAALTAAVLACGPAASATARRATVTGTYLVQPTGRVHVELSSTAVRVRVSYRTAAHGSRSRIVRIRRGRGATTLPTGARRVRARALATARRRASGRVRLHRNPLLRDVDGNGTREYHYDLDADGRYELVLFDDNRNGRFESVFLDSGATSGLVVDRDEDGYYELVALDANRDGQAERLFYDADHDGYPELQALDYVGGDGVADTWVDTRVPSGNARQDKAANDLMVKHIVTLNQLRQLDPWSTGYIPYDPSPSLL